VSEVTLKCSVAGSDLHFKLDLDENRHHQKVLLDHIKAGLLYERDVSLFMIRVLRPGDVFIDVGANIGFMTVLSGALVGPTGRVFAFEPGRNNLPELRHNIALNGFQHVEVIESPVSDRVEEVDFYLYDGDGNGNALFDAGKLPRNDPTRTTRVSLVSSTLDALTARFQQAGPVKLLKMDAEGAETRIINGGSEFLKQTRIPFVIAELHPSALHMMGTSPEELRALMESHGYQTYVLPYEGNLPKFVPPGTTIFSKYIRNLLFTQPEYLAPYFPTEYFE